MELRVAAVFNGRAEPMTDFARSEFQIVTQQAGSGSDVALLNFRVDLFPYALWAEATEAIQKFGTMVKSPSGYPIQSPYVSIANRQAEIMMRIASEFGFTPASRSRISTPAAREPTLFDIPEGSAGKATKQ